MIAQGYKVVEACNGAQALHLLGQVEPPIDLVLTDLVMPEIGGRELAAHVRQHGPKVPVVYTSGYSKDTGDFEPRSAHEEADYFLPKPFGPLDLAQRSGRFWRTPGEFKARRAARFYSFRHQGGLAAASVRIVMSVMFFARSASAAGCWPQ